MGLLSVAAVVGAVIGVLSGLLGIGGGTMVIPVLRLGFGLSTIESAATSLFTIVLTSLSGGVGHIRNRTAHVGTGLIIGLAGACFSPLGSMASTHIGNLATLLAEAVIFLYIAIRMFRRARRIPSDAGREHDGGERIRRAADVFKPADESAARDASGTAILAKDGRMEPEAREREHLGRMDARDAVLAAFIGATAGFAAGMLGIGGGFIIIPLSMAAFGYSMNEASGTSLIAIFPLSVAGTIAHALAGQVHFLYGLAMALGSIPGAYLGARLSCRVPEKSLRYLFSSVLVLVTGILVLNEFGFLG